MSTPMARVTGGRPLRTALEALHTWPVRRWVAAVVATAVAALVIGVPTGVVETGLYTRMTPVLWWDYPVWVVSAVLVGLTAATYVRIPQATNHAKDVPGRTAALTLLATFAVGCPICNKLVVAAIGVSGALSYWAPLQPVLGVASVALLALGLAVRLRGSVSCPVAPTAT